MTCDVVVRDAGGCIFLELDGEPDAAGLAALVAAVDSALEDGRAVQIDLGSARPTSAPLLQTLARLAIRGGTADRLVLRHVDLATRQLFRLRGLDQLVHVEP